MVIPANNSSDGKLTYSSLIRNEIDGLIRKNIEIDQHFLTHRFSPIRIIKFAKEVRHSLINSTPDLIHVQTGTAGLFMLFVKSKIPWILTIGGSDILGNPGRDLIWKFRGFIAGFVTTVCASQADRIICVSKNLKKALPQFLHKKIVILPRGVDINQFIPIPIELARQKLKWELDKNYVVFALTRSDSAVKNLPLARSVIDYYSSKLNSNIHLVLIENKTKEDVINMLNAANALLVTSIHEGSPNIVKEAMACNLPIVAVDCGDIKERLNEVSPSFVVASYNVKEISYALMSILIKKNRSNGRSILIEQGLAREKIIEKMIAIYKSCFYK